MCRIRGESQRRDRLVGVSGVAGKRDERFCFGQIRIEVPKRYPGGGV